MPQWRGGAFVSGSRLLVSTPIGACTLLMYRIFCLDRYRKSSRTMHKKRGAPIGLLKVILDTSFVFVSSALSFILEQEAISSLKTSNTNSNLLSRKCFEWQLNNVPQTKCTRSKVGRSAPPRNPHHPYYMFSDAILQNEVCDSEPFYL